MSSLPPLTVTVNSKKWSCVLDTDLALSRYGLILAQRLGEEFNLWLVRELWQILDNTQYYLLHPETLIPTPINQHQSKDIYEYKGCNLINETLNQWELARIQTDIAGLNIFWIGDAIRESLFPQDIDQHMIYRFETLARSLDERMKRHAPDSDSNIFVDCYRDAAALSAALMPYKGFLLTLHGSRNGESPENEPAICSFLRECGINCCRVEKEDTTKIEREFLNPILARSGISELLWAGLNLAAVHIIVPNAVIMPKIQDEEDGFQDEIKIIPNQDGISKKDWWSGAVSFWYPIQWRGTGWP